MQGPQNELLSRENLKMLYVDNPDASLASVASQVGSHRETVRRWIVRYGFPVKRNSRPGKPKKKATIPLANRDWLQEEMETKSCAQIARELGVTGNTVHNWAVRHDLIEHNINKSEAVKRGLAKKFPDGRFGEDAARWKGGRRTMPSGYVYIYAPEHPCATKNGCVMEHRLVAEEQIGRFLEPNEIVHHKDGDKTNNAPENLEVVTRGEHLRAHFAAIHEVRALKQRIAELEAKLEVRNDI